MGGRVKIILDFTKNHIFLYDSVEILKNVTNKFEKSVDLISPFYKIDNVFEDCNFFRLGFVLAPHFLTQSD